jgi:hypothetical protein
LDRPEDATELLQQLEDFRGPNGWTAADAARWWQDRGQKPQRVAMASG